MLCSCFVFLYLVNFKPASLQLSFLQNDNVFFHNLIFKAMKIARKATFNSTRSTTNSAFTRVRSRTFPRTYNGLIGNYIHMPTFCTRGTIMHATHRNLPRRRKIPRISQLLWLATICSVLIIVIHTHATV